MGSMRNASFYSNIPKTADNIVGTIYLLFGIFSLFGNIVLLYVSYQKRQLLRPAEYLIVNLAVSDLAMTLTLYPLAITSSFSHRWIYGRHICTFYAFCGVWFGICSLSTITLLSTVCCMKVCFPTYGNRFGHEHGRILIICAWAYAAIFALSPLAHWGEYGTEPYGTACCIDWHSSNVNRVARSYTIALFVFCFIIPCGVIITSYSLILVTVKTSQKAVEQHLAGPPKNNNVQIIIVKLSIAVCIGFFIAWSPYAAIALWAAFGSIDDIPPLVFAVPSVFAKSSTIYNPAIYLFLKPHFNNIVVRYFTVLQRYCLTSCLCLDDLHRCLLNSLFKLYHSSFKKGNKPICNSLESPEQGEKCKDTFECFKHYPKCCHEMLNAISYATPEEITKKDQKSENKNDKKAIRVIVVGQKQCDINDLEIILEVTPV
ncbi:opsin-5-like [Bombina bombina]|uniref:opsin-5-like n=1 Tax=Bombina bombina TaxID=8345 RepID=UPI00235AEDC6|nr:opsin-5-like [Bombina bombina]